MYILIGNAIELYDKDKVKYIDTDDSFIIRLGEFNPIYVDYIGSKCNTWFTKTRSYSHPRKDVSNIDSVNIVIHKNELVSYNGTTVSKDTITNKSNIINYKRPVIKTDVNKESLDNRINLVIIEYIIAKINSGLGLKLDLNDTSFELIVTLYNIQKYGKVYTYGISYPESEQKIISYLISRDLYGVL